MELEQKIDVKQALRVFNRVTKEGKKIDDGWQFHGLTASTDFDGYTVFLRTNRVELTIFFHNKFKVECSNALDLDDFVELLKKLDPD
ncbi:DUF3081 family protein [Microbulbifer agarilyticus]|uniref:DUF3081 family protein n=1 Tax=Microbulbifer agarilyticus TaxID=260552 RepID=UPI001C97AA91|nr:DUF3081 family protein [Microbulbifer agarilyticus]MBY6189140.1 DUF3081 domain-containing protein [Microbulbifer agarilyticus]MBY6212206.1 DUF3081 domain-containing protein [Microbulbifer agarilyticus]MCA0893742.1 DUF3081 domain-containing protein [Microbulbifer agarilyticus]